LFDAALVFVQYCPRRRGILAGHVTGRLGPREEVSYGVCLSLGLALRENRLSCLYETDIGICIVNSPSRARSSSSAAAGT
jgi:hypothetical protein